MSHNTTPELALSLYITEDPSGIEVNAQSLPIEPIDIHLARNRLEAIAARYMIDASLDITT